MEFPYKIWQFCNPIPSRAFRPGIAVLWDSPRPSCTHGREVSYEFQWDKSGDFSSSDLWAIISRRCLEWKEKWWKNVGCHGMMGMIVAGSKPYCPYWWWNDPEKWPLFASEMNLAWFWKLSMPPTKKQTSFWASWLSICSLWKMRN